MTARRLLICALLIAPASALAEAGGGLPRPNWDRELAQAVVQRERDRSSADHWLDLVRAGEFAAVAARLQAYRIAAIPSAPAREAAVLDFTIALAELPPADVPEALLEWLEAWPAQTLVAHEESLASAVPLFNIAAAARGTRAALQRRAGQQHAAELLAAGPGAWLAGYRAAGPGSRSGFLDALDAAPAARRAAVARLALARAQREPWTARVAAHGVLALNDPLAVLRLLVAGARSDSAALLRASADQFGATDRAILLLGAITDAPPDRAALAIALLAPGLSGHAEVTASLFDLLEHPDLGSSAALALAGSPDGSARDRLITVARGNGLAARRAALALRLEGLPKSADTGR